MNVAFWIMLIWVIAVNYLLRYRMTEKVLCNDGNFEYRAGNGFLLLLMSVPLLIISTRTDFVDSASYISEFDKLPEGFDRFYVVNTFGDARLFKGIQMIFKALVSSSPAVWLGFVACLQAFLIFGVLKKYSVDPGFSTFMFIATSMAASWMCNGIRQFIAVAVLFACTDLLLNGKWYIYLIIAVVLMGFGPIASFFYIDGVPWYLGGIHESVLIAILALPFINGKAFNKRLWLLGAILAVLVVTGGLDQILSSSVENTTYVNDMEYVDADTGTNIFRVLVQSAPFLLALLAYKELRVPDTPKIIQLSVNCSFVSTVLYVASAFTSGIYVGRLPIYFEIYNLILVPWLLSHPFGKNRKLYTSLVMLCYIAYFYYQVNVTWANIPLVSTLPGLGG